MILQNRYQALSIPSIKTTQTEVPLSTKISGLNEDTESKGSRRTEEEDENCGKLNKNGVEAIRNFTLSEVDSAN